MKRKTVKKPVRRPAVKAKRAAAPDMLPLNISDAAVAQLGSLTILRRKITPYQPPPGVVPDNALAMDYNPTTGSNYFGWLNQNYCGCGFPGYAYLSELSQRSEYRAPAETLSKEMTRKFVRFISKSKDPGASEKINALEAAFKRFDVRQIWRKALEVDLFFGRSQIYIDIDGAEDNPVVKASPLTIDEKTIKKDSLKGFKVIEPIWTTPLTYNSIDATKADFYKPEAWFVLGQRIHHTRLITVISKAVPDMLKPAYNFGGVSLTQLMEPYVIRWLKTVGSVNQLINNFSNLILKTNISDILSGKAVDSSGMMKRAKMFQATRDNQGLMLLDKNSEEMQFVEASLASLDKLQAQAQEHMAAPSHVPLVKLTGITPAGLNANSDGEIQVFHEWVEGEDQASVEPGLDVMFDVIQLNEFGKIDEDLDYEFVELIETTQKEKADTQKAKVELLGGLIDKGVIDADEARESVRRDPEMGLTQLEGDKAPGVATDPNVIDPETGEPRAPAVDPNKPPPKPGEKD